MKQLLYTFALIILLGACKEHKVESLVLDKNELTLAVGERYQLEIKTLPIESSIYNFVQWESSNSNVASVDSRGNVIAVYSGSCIITAKSGGKSVSCKVNVATLNYDLEFKKSKAFYYGDTLQTSSNAIKLYLIADDLTINNNEELSGNGVFLSLDLYISPTSKIIDSGKYDVTANYSPQTVLEGRIVSREGNYYAYGTYLGQWNSEGLTAVFINNGAVNVTIDDSDNYTIEVAFIGESGENIKAKYSGKIDIIDKSSDVPPAEEITINIKNVSIENQGNILTPAHNVMRLTISTDKPAEMLYLDLFVPLSSKNEPPVGTYIFVATAADARNFTLLSRNTTTQSEGSFWIKDGITTGLQRGSITISKSELGQILYKLSMTDEIGRIIKN